MEYNHNPLNLLPGDVVILDASNSNKSEVKIVSMTINKMFSRVHSALLEDASDKDCWDVMTNRLSL